MERKDIIKEFLSKPSVLFTYFGIASVVFVTTSMLTWLPTYFENVRQIPQEKAGQMASSVMLLAIIGAPLGGHLTDLWRKKRTNARLLYPALSSLLSAITLFIALDIIEGNSSVYCTARFRYSYSLIYIRSRSSYPGCYTPRIKSYFICNCGCGAESAGRFDSSYYYGENL